MDRRSQINDYLAGRLDVEEANELLQWINSPEGKLFLADETEEIWHQENQEETDVKWDGQEVWNRIQTSQQLGLKSVPKKETSSGPGLPLWLKVAASFVLFAFIGWAFVGGFDLMETAGSAEETRAELVSRYNPPGQKSKIQLPDGSIIFLNADSRVEYPVDFTKNRQVKLEGEAYFAVAKDSLHPFTVESQGIHTSVLGTTFNISTFPEDGKVQVTLLTGKVKLEKSGAKEAIVMNPGEEALLSQAEEGHILRQVEVGKRISWTSGVLEFEDAPFLQMVEILERWYGVQFEVIGPVPKDLSSGTFGRDESLENVLDVLSSSIGFSFEIDNNQVTINIMPSPM